MMTKRIYFFTGILLTCLACQSQKTKKAQLRIGQFMWSAEQASIDISREGEQFATLEVKYGDLTPYQTFKPGKYSVKVSVGDHLILNKKIGLGNDGIYTLYLAGIPQKGQPVNAQSVWTTLRKIVEGEAAKTDNHYLPQLVLQNDFFIQESGKGKMRLVPVMPGTVPLQASLAQHKQEVATFSKLQYMNVSKTEAISPGDVDVDIYLKDHKAGADAFHLQIEQNRLYTCFIIPDEQHYLTAQRLVVGETPSKQ